MPPAFPPDERDRIVEQLLATGKRLFTSQGLRKTSLDELVEPTGIAKSSFYSFFDSKESLYLELMLRNLPELRAQLFDCAAHEADAGQALRGFLRGALARQREDPLYRHLFTHPEELAAVARRVPAARLAEVEAALVNPVLELIERGQREGSVVPADPRVVFGVLQSVLAVPLAEDRLDPAVYQDSLDMLVELVVTGLTRPATTEERGKEKGTGR